MYFADILRELPEGESENGFSQVEGKILCDTYQRGLHGADLLKSLGISCYVKQLPMSHKAYIIEGEDPAHQPAATAKAKKSPKTSSKEE